MPPNTKGTTENVVIEREWYSRVNKVRRVVGAEELKVGCTVEDKRKSLLLSVLNLLSPYHTHNQVMQTVKYQIQLGVAILLV